MALTLQSMYEGLEAKVVDKTKRIEARGPAGGLVRGQRLPAWASTIEEPGQRFCSACAW